MKKNGRGDEVLNDQTSYRGTWINDLKHGDFIKFLPDSKQQKEHFSNGKLDNK